MRMETHDGRSNAMQQHYFGIERQARERQEGLLREAQGRRLALEARVAGAGPITHEEGANTMGQKTNKAKQAAGGTLVGRMVLLLATVLAVVLVAGGTALAATTAFANPTPIQITDTGVDFEPASPYPSQIDVNGLSGTIQDVNLKLSGFGHTFPEDVDVLLVGPSGQTAVVMSDTGHDIQVGGVDLTLDDEAAESLPGDVGFAPLTSGTFKPTDHDFAATDDSFPAPAPAPGGNSVLSVFEGTDPNGAWKLFVVDDAAQDSGAFASGWSLEITTGSLIPQPDTTAPRVKSTIPQAHATGVSPTANVKATFSEDMKASTINAQTFKLFKKGSTTKMAAKATYDPAADRAILDPDNPLKRSTTYRAVVTTDARDLAGNRLDQNSSVLGPQQKLWSFEVGN